MCAVYLAFVFAASCGPLAISVGIAARSVRAHSGRILATQRLVAEETIKTASAFERTLQFDNVEKYIKI